MYALHVSLDIQSDEWAGVLKLCNIVRHCLHCDMILDSSENEL